MTKPEHLQRWTSTSGSPADLDGILPPEGYTLHTSRRISTHLDLFDDFDRAIAKSNFALVRRKGALSIVSADNLQETHLEGPTDFAANALFWWSLESGVFQENLRSIIDLRAACLVTTATLQHRVHTLRNEDEKIVLRVTEENVKVGTKAVQCTVQLAPLLGYEAEACVVAKQLEKHVGLERDEGGLLWKVLAAAGQDKLPLSPKQAIQLNSNDSVQVAVTRISDFMLQVARQNEQGIIDDVDSEFLHDYRVAIRKLRSVLALTKGAYPKEDTRRLKKQLGDLARATNRLRDLDVYLLDQEVYRQSLPEALRPGLDRMFADFRKEQTQVLRSTKRRLQSKTYERNVTKLQDWFRQDSLPGGVRENAPIGFVAAKEILKHYHVVRKTGSPINAATPDEEVHELRIECKKLRYLLELYGSLFDEKEIKAVTKRLKRLQDVLGRFNDYAVQQDSLHSYLQSAGELDAQTSAAVGGLIAGLYQAQLDARSHVTERFEEFNGQHMREHMEALFGKKGGKA